MAFPALRVSISSNFLRPPWLRSRLKRIKSLDELGLFRVIDGSLFPTLIQMSWSEYRKAKNAFKLHLSFELNRLIPTEFLVGSGKSSERAFLESVLEAGVTYIADRGYGSFEIVAKVLESNAYFIFRVKNNLLYEVQEGLKIAAQELPPCFRQVRDELIVFKNDKHRAVVRLIEFEVCGSYFQIMRESERFIHAQDNYLIRLSVADRVIFQVSETDIEGITFVQPQSKLSGDTVLSADEVSHLIVEVEAKLSKKRKEKKSCQGRKD
ncbi:MAG: transposase [Pyrinomonadaceae bacterium]